MPSGTVQRGLEVPSGFYYRDAFVPVDEAAALVDAITRLDLSPFELRGFVAKRRVAYFGASYDSRDGAPPPIPGFLKPLRDRIAAWAGITADEFVMALVNEYSPGTAIGWHRDAPQFGIVAGVSLLTTCRMTFRVYERSAVRRVAGRPRRIASHDVLLQPRSAYLMTGEARSAYEHHIPPVAALRDSITFRTRRRRRHRDDVEAAR